MHRFKTEVNESVTCKLSKLQIIKNAVGFFVQSPDSSSVTFKFVDTWVPGKFEEASDVSIILNNSITQGVKLYSKLIHNRSVGLAVATSVPFLYYCAIASRICEICLFSFSHGAVCSNESGGHLVCSTCADAFKRSPHSPAELNEIWDDLSFMSTQNISVNYALRK